MYNKNQRSLEKIAQLISELQKELINLTGSDLFNSEPIKLIALDKEKSFEEKASIVLHTLGIPAKLSGYEQILITLNILAQHPSPMKTRTVTKEIYPIMAKQLNTTDIAIGRNTRYAIWCACNKGNTDLLIKLFPHYINNIKAGIPNCEFLFRILEYIQKGY